MPPPVLTILAISGSLRAHSTNTELLKACALLAPDGVNVELYLGLAGLPHFNADLDTHQPPAEVVIWRGLVRRSNALLISSPEYARGVPGAMKNALDWLVGSSDVVNKPVVLLNGSPRASHAQSSLALTLQTISARLIAPEPYLAPVLGKTLNAEEIVRDDALATVLRTLLRDLIASLRAEA